MQLDAKTHDRLLRIQNDVSWWYEKAREVMSDDPPDWVRKAPTRLTRKGLARASQRLGYDAWCRLQRELARVGL